MEKYIKPRGSMMEERNERYNKGKRQGISSRRKWRGERGGVVKKIFNVSMNFAGVPEEWRRACMYFYAI